MKDKDRKAIQLPPVSLNKEGGFTIIEILLVALILALLFTGLFQTLNIGQFSNAVSLEKINLQSNVRNAIDWIVRDVRETDLIEINTNSPSTNHIKFRKVTGIDNTNGEYTVASNYIEYNYNNVSSQIIRNEIDTGGSIVGSWVFNNITESPFYTAPGVPLVGTPGAPGNIVIAKKLLVVIAGQRQVRNSLTLNLTLTEEVKIRNE